MRNCIMAREGEEEEEASVDEGASCELPATFMMQQHANESLDKTTEQESSASPPLRRHFCKAIHFLHLIVRTRRTSVRTL